MTIRCAGALICTSLAFLSVVSPALAQTPATQAEYRVLATSRTSTMEKEMNQAASAGFRFSYAMGGETAIGGKEVVAVMERRGDAKAQYHYRLLATSRTSTMQREIQQAADDGYEYRTQTVFDSMFGGKEVACILEKDLQQTSPVRYGYRLLATSRTSTMEKELQESARQGYTVVGLTVGQTAAGGSELVTILRRRIE
jgi:hypothetical protein